MQQFVSRPTESKAEITVDAPGHSFHCGGPGVEVKLSVEGDQLLAAEGRFPLAALTTSDPIGRAKLSDFLNQKSQPMLTAKLSAPVALSAGEAKLEFQRDGGAAMSITARWDPSLRPQAGLTAALQLEASFTGFGYKPPKLLFFSVKDPFALRVELQLDEA